eukprot:12934465-Prorocentrum_lima.AAC.1
MEHPMYAWHAFVSCFITSYNEEGQDIGEVEFYQPPALVHWHNSCPRELTNRTACSHSEQTASFSSHQA